MSVLTYYRTTFAPYDVPDPAQHILELVNDAHEQIRIDIYGFTWPPLMDALIAAHARGVDVSIVADHTQAEGTAEKPQLQRLVDAGIPVLIGTSSRGAIDHSKYVIVDGATVGFGSFNFSASALAQDNTFTETNDSAMVATFLANWMRVYSDATGKHPDWQLSASAAVSPPSTAALRAGDGAGPPSPAPTGAS
jgi:phosphatidylserine/phosphatidylglycerophosphate/cardiolipin synthase-like enzyme